MPTLRIEAGDVELAVDDHGGSGVPLLLLHGGGGDASVWNAVVPLLPDFRVVAYDTRGHGRSDEPETFRADAVVEDVGRVAEALGLDRPVLVGHSMGGATATRFAARGGACRGRVLVDGAHVRTDEPVERVESGAYLEHLREFGIPEERLDLFLAMRRAGEELNERETVAIYDEISCPRLVVAAREGLTNLGPYTEKQRRVLDDLGAVWLECGHDIPRARPAELARLVREFAEQLA